MATNQVIIMVTMLCYMAFVVLVGVYIGRRTKRSSEGFYLGGRSVGPVVTAMSAEASDMSSYLLMGIPGVAYLAGVPEAVWTALGLAVGTYLNFLLVAKRLRVYSKELDAVTIPDFISKRFGEKKPVIESVAAIIIIIFFVPYVASGLVAIGKLFNSLFGWPFFTMVVIGALVIISYTTVGGFKAVATMDLIQSIIMTTSLIVIVLFAIHVAGGWDAVIANGEAYPGYLNLTQGYNAETGEAASYGPIVIISTLAWGLGYFGMPHILVRFMAIRDPNEIKLSRRIGATWVVISMGVAIIIGITGFAVSQTGQIPLLEGGDSERVLVFLANLLSTHGVLAAVVGGIMISGIMAATMSTADSQLLVAASAFSENIVQGMFGKKLNEKQTMLAARATVIAIAIIALFFARNPDSSIFRIVSFAWAGFGACFGPAILLALFSRRANRQGIAAGMVCGAITIFVWKFVVRPMGGALDIYELLPAFLVNLVIAIIVSRVTAAPDKDVTDHYDHYLNVLSNL